MCVSVILGCGGDASGTPRDSFGGVGDGLTAEEMYALGLKIRYSDGPRMYWGLILIPSELK